jgi:hypothetical protein
MFDSDIETLMGEVGALTTDWHKLSNKPVEKKTAKAFDAEAADIALKLNRAQSMDEGEKLLHGNLRKSDLLAIADAAGITINPHQKKSGIRHSVLDGTVGYWIR